MNSQEAVIEKFYSSFKSNDLQGMIACYHSDLIFEDPVFGKLDYKSACAMWEMLLLAGKDLEIYFRDVTEDRVKWEARYTFSKSKRKVHNKIEAKFKFKDGKIVSHVDHFDLYKWSRMALGFPGVVLGWTPFFKNKIRKSVKMRLEAFLDKSIR